MDWPAEVLTFIYIRYQVLTTELVLSTDEEIDADDGENGENEALEYHDIE